MPLACSRRIQSEFAGSVNVKLVPALLMEFVTGKTFTGAASEFSFAGLPEVNWMTVAVGAMELTPVTLTVVATELLEGFTALTMTCPDDRARTEETWREAELAGLGMLWIRVPLR